jgi:fructokinase
VSGERPAGNAVIVVGEALVDVSAEQVGADGGLRMTARAGGSPANVAVGLARLGVPTRFAGRISREPLGGFLRAHLMRSGVDVTLCVDAPERATLAIVGLDEGGGARYSFYLEGTADWRWKQAELPANEAGDAIHTGSLAIALEPGAQALADWVAEQRSRGAFVSLDPNVRPSLMSDLPDYRRRVDALIEQAQLVKLSDEDLQALEPAAEPLEIARRWAVRGPELVVVTHGSGGATALAADGEPVHCDAAPVELVDTVGAGDAFTAGLLAFLREHGALRVGGCAALDPAALAAALRFAGIVAAATCARPGADPPWRSELDAPPLAGA